MKNNKGVSMITLVITIILIIILALITYASSTRAIENANYSNFVSGVSEVATAFEKASLDMNSTPMLIKDPKRMEQIYHYVAYAGEEEEDFLEYYELPAYSIMQKEMDIGMEVPEVKVESGTGHVIPIKYAATLTGKVFIWPPYEYEGKLYINQEDVVDYKLQEDIIVGGEEIKIIIDSGDGSLLDAPSGEGIYDDDYEFDDEYEDGEGEGEEEPGEEEEAHLFAEKKATEEYLASEATCLTPAKYYFKCINCDLKGTKTYSYGSALSHNWGAYTKTKTPTCAETGMEQRICKRCNEVESVVLPKDTKNHVGEHVQEIMREANCVETERISTKCSACNIVLSVQEGEKNLENHKGPEKTLVTKQATCTEAGTKQTRCSACDVILEVNQIEAKGHSFGNWIVTDEATCKEEGEQQRSCSSCGTSEKAEIQKDANNHKKEAVREYYTEATCTESGKKETRCTDCEVSLSTQTVAPLGHTYKAVVTAPTYEANGFTTYTCERCGDTYIGDETPKLVRVPFAIYSETDKSLRFYNNADVIKVGEGYKGLSVTALYTGFEKEEYVEALDVPWAVHSGDVVKVVVEEEIAPLSTRRWFNQFRNLTSVDLAKLNTSNTTTMRTMFQRCEKLESIDISHFDTSKVTDMSYMFNRCHSLKNLDVSKFKTENVTTMRSMFSECGNLERIDVNGFDTSKVTDMSYMFSGKNYEGNVIVMSIKDLDISGFNTANVTDMTQMFYMCTSLTELDISDFDTSNVTSMELMFSGGGGNYMKLKKLDVSGWNTSKVINMRAVFQGCKELTTIDVSGWDTSKTTDMAYMFNQCQALKALDVSNFDTSNVEDMRTMFQKCLAITTLDLSNWDTSKVTDMSYMFSNCESLVEFIMPDPLMGDLTGDGWVDYDDIEVIQKYLLDMISLTEEQLEVADVNGDGKISTSDTASINALVLGKTDRHPIHALNFVTTSVTDMSYMFNDCQNLKSLDLRTFDTSSVTKMENMISNCYRLEKVGLGSNFDFTGAGEERLTSLPTPNQTYITNADGKWYNIETDIGYEPASVPSKTCAVYTAKKPAEAFAIYSDEDKSLRFYKNADLGSIAVGGEYNNLSVDAIYTGFEEEQYGFEDVNTNTRAVWAPMFVSAPWNENPRYTKVYVEEKISPISTAAWFYDVQNLEYGDFSYLDTSNVTNMMDMFNNAGINVSNFEIVGLSNWDVSKVTNMSGMFQYNAINATRFILDNIWDWDISKVEDMSYMFAYSKVSNLDLTNWDTSNVINMSGMFKDCTVLRTFNGGKEIIGDANENGIIDYGDATLILEALGGNATGEINGDVNGDGKSDSSDAVAIMRYVAGYTSTYIQAPLNFNTTKVTNMDSMFQNCSSLEVLDLVTFNTGAVTSMNNMFNGSINLEVVNLGPNFAFIGTSGYLQAQTSENVSGANGKWYNIETGTGYLPSEIPNNTAATYSAKAPEDGEFECPSCGHYGLDGYQEFCSRCNYWYGECICTICGADFSRRHDCPYAACDAGNHTYGNWVTTTAATCTSRGVQTATCSVCGTTKTQVLEKLAHSYGSYVITTAATCTTSGVKTATCNNCTATTTQTISATGHSYNATYSYDSTNHWQECSACGDKQNTGTHRYGTYTVTKAATCTSTGTKKATCTTCTKTDTQTISKTSHSYGSYVTTTAATCTTAGVKTATCNNCTATTTQTIDATGHNYSYYSSSAGDCNTQGYTKEKCSKCGDISTTYTGYGSCDYYVYSSISGTCTTISSTTYKCSECGDTYTSTGSYGSCSYYTYSSTSGTCTTRGSTTYKCSYCGDTYTSTGSYGSCSYSKTCSKSGCTYKQCSNCGSTTGSHASSCFGCSTCGGTGKISKWQSDSWKIPCEGFSGCTHAANTTFTIPYQTCRVCGIISYSAFNYCPNVRDTDHTENCSCSDPDCPDC